MQEGRRRLHIRKREVHISSVAHRYRKKWNVPVLPTAPTIVLQRGARTTMPRGQRAGQGTWEKHVVGLDRSIGTQGGMQGRGR